MAGREGEITVEKAGIPKRIFEAGGGPAGMSFAVTAAQRGHEITLFESGEILGGQVNRAKASPGKEELGNITKSFQRRMMKYGVDIKLMVS